VLAGYVAEVRSGLTVFAIDDEMLPFARQDHHQQRHCKEIPPPPELNSGPASGLDRRVVPFTLVPISQQAQRRFVGRSGFGGVDDEDLIRVARWIERLVLNGDIAHERMVVSLGPCGSAFHIVVRPPGTKLHRPDGQLADQSRQLLVMGMSDMDRFCRVGNPTDLEHVTSAWVHWFGYVGNRRAFRGWVA
jgi:hypothetical protein